jgi:putative tryptophan/tyrosine transport system substrate-binding protein
MCSLNRMPGLPLATIDSSVALRTSRGSRRRSSLSGALLVGNSILFNNRRRQLAALAARHGVPAIGLIREFVLAGGLMSYGASDTDAYRRAGSQYVAPILRGTKPGDLPVEMPTKYELVINVVAAKALGLEIPDRLLTLADEVIE